MRRSGLHLIHGSLSPPESTTQTAFRSVLPFLHSSPQSVPIFTMSHPSPSKLPLPIWDLDPHLIVVSWVHPSPQPKRHVDPIDTAVFAALGTVTDGQTETDRQTDHATRCVTTGRIYVHVVLPCGLKIKCALLNNPFFKTLTLPEIHNNTSSPPRTPHKDIVSWSPNPGAVSNVAKDFVRLRHTCRYVDARTTPVYNGIFNNVYMQVVGPYSKTSNGY